MTASILNSVGTFINIISQLIAATAVIAVIAPNLGVVPAVLITAVFMVLYVVFGGTKGAGMVGILKTVLLYAAMLVCGAMVLYMVGGISAFVDMVHSIDNPEGVSFFSVFARGAGTDLGAGLSLLFGVLTTQTYAQAVLSARSDKAGRGGALLSAFLIPPIGIGGILVGLYMRAHAALYPGLTAKTALTTFVTAHIPPLFAGVILATLFIATVGTGAGLALGISTVLNNDIVKHITHKFDTAKRAGLLAKVWIIAVLALACCMSTGALGDLILQFAFMSMGLRAAVVFCPLCAALFFPGRVNRRWAIAAIVAGPLMVLVGELLGVPFDSLFLGLAAALVLTVLGGPDHLLRSLEKELCRGIEQLFAPGDHVSTQRVFPFDSFKHHMFRVKYLAHRFRDNGDPQSGAHGQKDRLRPVKFVTDIGVISSGPANLHDLAI